MRGVEQNEIVLGISVNKGVQSHQPGVNNSYPYVVYYFIAGYLKASWTRLPRVDHGSPRLVRGPSVSHRWGL